ALFIQPLPSLLSPFSFPLNFSGTLFFLSSQLLPLFLIFFPISETNKTLKIFETHPRSYVVAGVDPLVVVAIEEERRHTAADPSAIAVRSRSLPLRLIHRCSMPPPPCLRPIATDVISDGTVAATEFPPPLHHTTAVAAFCLPAPPRGYARGVMMR
ncbi:hypothetical protein LINPERPRIM_LOCUS10930, partial [Linum perenne]